LVYRLCFYATNILYIDFANTYEKRRIEIYDAFGKLVLSEDIPTQHSTLNTHHLQSGIYFYKAVAGDKIHQSKLVIIK
jgi:hypothetical protein